MNTSTGGRDYLYYCFGSRVVYLLLILKKEELIKKPNSTKNCIEWELIQPI